MVIIISYHTLQAECLSTLLSYNLDLKVEDYARDTAQRVAEIYNHQNCIETIREFLAKQEEAKSPKSPKSPSTRSRSPREKSPKHSIGVKGLRGREGSTSQNDKSRKDQKTHAKRKNNKQLNH